MTSDESIPTDASTVHRKVAEESSDATTDAPLIESPLYASREFADSQDVENAKTVIRDGSDRGGSSRAQRASDNLDSLNRTPAAITRILLGKQLNHFLLQELIGGGGMGAVFRAHDEQLDRVVAIKVIPFAGEDPDLQRRFRNEAQSAAKLDHPRIARVFDVGHQDDWYYIVFEYIKGTNIRDLVNRSDVLAIDDAVYYTCQVAEALQHASDRGIVHRDVKPSNVLIDSDREVKLVDMGLARSDNLEMSQEDLTASGVTLGTFDYISPEQAKDPRAADLRSDIYSLGCTLYFMLTGQPPYPGGTMLQKLLSHGNAPPPDARQVRSGVSYELATVIQKMLAKDPDQRYQSANGLVADLREIAFREGLMRSQGVSATPIGVANPVVSWLERNAPWLVAAILLFIGVGWLQLSSAASRDEFKLTPPSARLTTGDSSNASLLPERASDNKNIPDLPEKGTAIESIGPMDSRTPLTNSDGKNSIPDGVTDGRLDNPNSPSDPPRLNDVPVPSELGTDKPLTTASNFPAAKNIINDSLIDKNGTSGTSVADSLSNQDATLVEFPRIIRVISNEAVTVDELGNEIKRDIDGAALTTSLAKSLELAEQYDVNRIELATSLIYSEPISIRRDGFLLASTVGGSTIVFQTPATMDTVRTEMITLGSNKIEFDDIHFVWDIPASQMAGGTLISLNANRLVRLTDCSITIGNLANRKNVSAFSVTTGPDTTREIAPDDLDRQSQANSLPLVALQMYNVIVRGQISLIEMDYAAALQLQWENGLLAISRRMIETSGARVVPSLTSSPLQLSLTRLTSHTPLGLVQMRLGGEGRYPVTIDRDVSNCVFVVDKGASHVEVTGLSTLENDPPILKSRGEANAYEVDRAMLSLSSGSGRTSEVLMRDLAANSPAWWDERSTRWTIWWKQGPADETTVPTIDSRSLLDLPPDQRTTADYRQDGAVFGGFDEKSLPILPFGSDNRGLDTPVTE